MQNIHICEVDGKQAVCFDTGLDARSFARTKMSQSLIEPGYIFYPNPTADSYKTWKAVSVNDINGFMRVWGTPFFGERLDSILNKVDGVDLKYTQAALEAIVYWIKAKLFLGDTRSVMNPSASFVSLAENKAAADSAKAEFQKGSVFFGPESLSLRCLLLEGMEVDSFNCPDLTGMEAAAFCAAAMLYKVLLNAHPYPGIASNIYQDMREGVFIPPRLVSPGLDKKLSELINSALSLPVANKKTSKNGLDILNGFMEILLGEKGEIAPVSALFHNVSKEEDGKAARERKRYITRQNIITKSKRFYLSNKPAVISVSIVAAFLIFVIVSIATSRNERMTTAGMSPETVVKEYYEAFSILNHTFMDTILMSGADRSDINTAVNLFAISRVRQTHEQKTGSAIISARLWKELGRELPAPDVFGVTDLTLTHLGGNETDGVVVYRADYLLWFPHEDTSSSRSDEIILERARNGNWRIAEIYRTLNSGF